MKVQELFGVCDEGSDKASAMNVQGYAEDFLGRLLKSHKAAGRGQRATFAAMIGTASKLELIDTQMEKDLHCIRNIRNKFAHSKEPISYDESPVRELRQLLSTAKEYEDKNKDSRWKYMSAAVTVLGRLYHLVEKSGGGQ